MSRNNRAIYDNDEFSRVPTQIRESKRNSSKSPDYLRGSAGTLVFLVTFVILILIVIAIIGASPKKDNSEPQEPTSPSSVGSSSDISATDASSSDASDDKENATVVDDTPQPPEKLSIPAVSELENASIRSSLEKTAKKYGCSAVSIAVIDNGEISSVYTYGNSSGANASITSETKIRVASLSKVIIGITALKMAEDGLLSLDQDISDIAGFRIRNPHFPDTPITMRHLLCHTSTISTSNLDIGAANSSDPTWLPAQLKKKYPFTKKQPGKATSFEYSNSGYCVAGYLMELAAKKTINEYFQENFLNPLNIDAAFCAGQLSDTSNIAALVNAADSSNSLSVSGQLKRPYSQKPGENSYPYAGDYTTSAVDFARLVCILINDGTYCGHEFLKPESVQLMEQMNLDTGNSKIPRVQCLTLKQFKKQIDNRTLYYHTGVAYGHMGYIGYDPETKDGVVILTIGSMNSSKEKDVNEVCLALAEICFSKLCA